MSNDIDDKSLAQSMEDDDIPVFNLDNIDLRPSNSRPIIFGRDNFNNVLYPGAHIAAGIGHGPHHHGIVLSIDEDISIAHFWGRDKAMARIQTTTLDVFIAGDPDDVGIKMRSLYLINYQDDNDEKRAETVQRARTKLERAGSIYYDIISSNCESFAYYCRTGQWESEQSSRIIGIIKSLASRAGRSFLSVSRDLWTHIQNSSTAQSSNLIFLSLLTSGSLVSGSSLSTGSSSPGSIPLISISSASIGLLLASLSTTVSTKSMSSEGSIDGITSSLGSINDISTGTVRLGKGTIGSTTKVIDSIRSSVAGTISASQRISNASVNVTTATLGSLRRSMNATTGGTVRLGADILNSMRSSLGSSSSSFRS